MTKHAALAALALFALAGPAAAQPGPPPGMPAMPSEADMKARMAEHEAQMDKDMHTILRLRPDQEAAWRAFRDATRPPGGPDGMVRISPPKPGQTTPQRLDEMDRMAAEHQARRATAQAATRAFYAALSPEQQAVFDALHRLRGGFGGGPRVMTHGGPGGGDVMFERHLFPQDGPGGPPRD